MDGAKILAVQVDNNGMADNAFVQMDITLMVLFVYFVLTGKFGIQPQKLVNAPLAILGMETCVRNSIYVLVEEYI